MSAGHKLAAITLLATSALAATLASGGGKAEAGQPWSCICQGKARRFIASTYKCEHDLWKGKGVRVSSGFRLFVPRCTRAQFRVWQAKACRKAGCLPPR